VRYYPDLHEEPRMDEPKLDDMTRRVMSYSKHMDLRTFSGIATFFRANLLQHPLLQLLDEDHPI
jgi:hypothetical protein